MRLRLLLLALLPSALVASPPEPPRNTVNTAFTPAACTTTVASGGNVQTAINSAALGDTVCLEAGATFTGNFTLPNKGAGSSYITIRTATPDSAFPRPGTRVAPGNASLMSKLTVGSGEILAAQNGAHHYRFVGLEITPSAAVTNLINLGPPSGLEADIPSYLIFDRCYIHGHATNGSRRGIALNSAWTAVIDSYLSAFMEVGADTQTMAGWGGPGPFKIVNNYLEAAGENVMFGGADPTVTNLVPSDIEFRRNHLYKPLTWRVGDPSYAGTHWSVKNSFELKNARRIVIENNDFEYCWADGQNGVPIVFTPRNQSNTAPWSTVEDVLFRSNVIRHAAGGVNIMGEDTDLVSAVMYRVAVEHNVFMDIDQAVWSVGGSSYLFQVLGGAEGPHELSLSHNTAIIPTTNTKVTGFAGTDAIGFVQRYNVSSHSDYGVLGDGSGVGDASLDEYAPSASFTANVLADQPSLSGSYSGHSGNFFPANMAAVGFVNLGAGNYRLDASSAYDGTGDGGSDLGAFFPAAGQSFLDLEVQATGTSAVLRFGRQGLDATASCVVRYGAASITSNSGGSIRYVVLTGLTNAQQYAFSVDCGDQDGDIADSLFTAATPSGGDRTVPVQIGPPSTALAALGAARCTLDYDDNAALSSPTSVQDTSCSSGGSADMTVPAGVTWYRWRWQSAADAVLATGTPQPLAVP